jgi:hypothetical protein
MIAATLRALIIDARSLVGCVPTLAAGYEDEQKGPGPMVVVEFLAGNDQFVPDRSRTRLLFTLHYRVLPDANPSHAC